MLLGGHVKDGIEALTLGLVHSVDPQSCGIAIGQIFCASKWHVWQGLLGQLVAEVGDLLEAELRLQVDQQGLDARQQLSVPLRVGH